MKLQKTTLVLIILALSLAIGVYFSEVQRAYQQEANLGNQQKLFDLTLEEITGLTITTQSQVIELVRGDRKTSQWQMQRPENVPANDAVVDFLLGLIVETKVDRPLPLTNNQFIEYGLNSPLATIEIKSQNKPTYKLFLGKQTFDKSSLYAYKDTESNKSTTPTSPKPLPQQALIVPLNFQNAVDRSLSEWKISPPATSNQK